MTGRIHLKNMEFYGYHGCHPGEKAVGQRFLVDLVLTLDISRAAASDALSDAVNYERVHEACRTLMEKRRVRLLEKLCKRIGDAILRGWPQVERVEVTVKKPEAPMPGKLDYVAVETVCERSRRLPRAR
jgi:dihydroneopterin aldolase